MATTKGQKGGGTAASVQVGVAAVPGLPRSAPHPGSVVYRDAMAQVRKKGRAAWGKWFLIATFQSPNGAASVKRQLLTGRKPVDGLVREWDIETRRTRGDDGELDGSQLYVRMKVPRAKK